MPSTRVKVPEYPRPISPVCVDEIPICADTIVYYDGGSNQGEDIGERAAKRRRIGAYATSYLRGEALFISTAQLKGPFNNGWQNPWARKRALGDQTDQVTPVGPQEDVKNKQQESQSRATSTRAQPEQANIPLDEEKSQKPAKRAESLDEIRFWKRKDLALPQSIQEEHGKTRQVEDWLRRNSSYDQPEHQMPPQQSFSSISSPTYKYSQKRGMTKKWQSSPIHIEFPPVSDAVVDILTSRDAGNLGTTPQVRHPRRVSPPREPEGSYSVDEERPTSRGDRRDMFHLHDMDRQVKGALVKDDADIQACQGLPSAAAGITAPKTSPTLEDDASQTDKRIEHLHPTCGEQLEREQDLSACTDESHHELASNVASASLHTAPERSTLQQHDSEACSPSKEASKASILHNLPSAQVEMQPSLDLAPSNLSSNGLLLQELSDRPVAVDTGVKFDDHPSTTMAVERAACTGDKHNASQNEPVAAAEADEGEQPNAPESNLTNKVQVPQDSLPSASPTDVRGTKYPTTKSEKGSSPKKLFKRKKRAAFTTDEPSSGSSQGSIKMAMKVAKPSIRVQDRVKRLKIDLAADTGVDAGEDLSQSSILHEESVSRLLRGTSCPKGILRSSLTNSAGPPLSTAHETSTSVKQDAQRPMKLTEIENGRESLREDDFDPDAVMDDLGSFLRTWDSEKEAAGL
ncbi:hypothetical protein PV11_03299 [Exophiala sideris]|uniref:Protamine P1 n=1 Tax=Exophiala sideris TaxID=1016849 RepID=A0A0D1YYT0_9EURO|nr:hypothetical protein PV11_03299 [Exophiala sideris]